MLAEYVETRLATMSPIRICGHVTEISPSACRVAGLSRLVKLGDRVLLGEDASAAIGEVIRIEPQTVLVKSYAVSNHVAVRTPVILLGVQQLSPSRSWRGRIVNALGAAIDGGGPPGTGESVMPLDATPPDPLRRARIATAARTGIRAIDLFTPLCFGQRIGVFAGSGVGKSTLLAMLARADAYDTVVIALVGERGREVREFLEETLGGDTGKVVAVVSTSDESPMMRRLAPRTATTIAEYFREQGDRVLLIVDSITRFAHAARDVALAAGEAPVARGYPPSVFSELPRLLERAGAGIEGTGSITGLYSVLVDGDDHNDPVADAIRGTLDGHIVLDRAIADEGRFPAVNVLRSISRLAEHAWTDDQRVLIQKLRAMIAKFENTRDVRLIGGYQPGVDPDLDQAIALAPKLYGALQQRPGDPPSADAFKDLADRLQAKSDGAI